MPKDLPPFPAVGGSYRLSKDGKSWEEQEGPTLPGCVADLQAEALIEAAEPDQTAPTSPEG